MALKRRLQLALVVGAISENRSQDRISLLALLLGFGGPRVYGPARRARRREPLPGIGSVRQFSHGLGVSRSLQQAADQPSLRDCRPSGLVQAMNGLLVIGRSNHRLGLSGHGTRETAPDSHLTDGQDTRCGFMLPVRAGSAASAVAGGAVSLTGHRDTLLLSSTGRGPSRAACGTPRAAPPSRPVPCAAVPRSSV